MIVHYRNAIAYFSNQSKQDRELHTVRAFLRAIGLPHADDEIQVGDAEPIDVTFRSGRFQIMEILGERRRMDEFRERLRRAQTAKRIADLSEPWTSSKPLTSEDVASMVAEELTKKAERYGRETCGQLDALVYLNIPGHHLLPYENGAFPESELLSKQGWRSVSILAPPYGVVAIAQAEAPDFIKENVGRVVECESIDGCFGDELPPHSEDDSSSLISS